MEVSGSNHQDPRALAVEHAAIASALHALGVEAPAALPADVRADDLARRWPVVVAWSPREDLMLRPEWSFLMQETVQFVRLPTTLERIHEAITQPRPRRPTLYEAALFTPLGQIKSALGALAESAGNEGAERTDQRLAHLRRFTRTHWPGWYDGALTALNDLLQLRGPEAMGTAAQALGGYCAKIAVYACFDPFFHGAGSDVAGSGPGPTRAALHYLITTPIGQRDGLLARVRDIIQQQPWWSSFADELAQTSACVNALTQAGVNPDDVLCGRLQRVQSNLAQFSAAIDVVLTGDRPSIDDVSAAFSPLDEMIRTIKTIEADADALREELKSHFGEATAPRR